jgi:hypothetical protein
VSVFIISPWYSLILAAVGSLFFPEFYEIFAVGIIADNLYGIDSGFANIPMFLTIISGIIFIATAFLKKRLKFYV